MAVLSQVQEMNFGVKGREFLGNSPELSELRPDRCQRDDGVRIRTNEEA
jgi:hypothetical protein